MKLLNKLRERSKILKKEISVIYYAYKNPETGLLPKILIMITLAYALSPIDLIPDFIPVLGLLDDFIIIPALIVLSIKLIPCKIMEESRIKAEKEPVNLKRNPLFAVIFVSLWLILLIFIITRVFSFLYND